MQHCSYNRDKTFNILDPKREFQGDPDGLPMPTPDYIFCSWRIRGKDFIENGFSPNQVFLTGTQSIITLNYHAKIKYLILETVNLMYC